MLNSNSNRTDGLVTYRSKLNTSYEHLCLVGDRPHPAVSGMSKDAILAEIEWLGDRVQLRMEETPCSTASPYASAYMSDRESSRMHDLKMALPSAGDEMLAAKERILARIQARNAKRKARLANVG